MSISKKDKMKMIESFAKGNIGEMVKIADQFDKEGSEELADFVDCMIEFKKENLKEANRSMGKLIRSMKQDGWSEDEVVEFVEVYKIVASHTLDAKLGVKIASDLPELKKERRDKSISDITHTTGIPKEEIEKWNLSDMELSMLAGVAKKSKNPKKAVEKFIEMKKKDKGKKSTAGLDFSGVREEAIDYFLYKLKIPLKEIKSWGLTDMELTTLLELVKKSKNPKKTIEDFVKKQPKLKTKLFNK